MRLILERLTRRRSGWSRARGNVGGDGAHPPPDPAADPPGPAPGRHARLPPGRRPVPL